MKIIKHTATTRVSARSIWKIWTDVSNWNQWDDEIEYSSIDGPFDRGSKGKLKAKGGPEVVFTMLEVKEGKFFKDSSVLPFCVMTFTHSLKEESGLTSVTHEVEMTGLLAPLFAWVIGRKIKKGLPNAMKNLVRLAETYEQ